MTTVIKAGQAGPILKHLSTVDLADHLAEAQAVIAAAKRRASQIVSVAEHDAERIRETVRQAGYQEGYDQGHKEGTKVGRTDALETATRKFNAEHTGIVAAMERAIVEIDSIKEDLAIQAEQHLLDFAIRLAQKLTYVIGKLDRESAKANLDRSLRLVDAKTNLIVHIHPDDVASLETFAAMVPEVARRSQSLEIVPDETMAPGGCRVMYGRFEVDATLDTQIEEMVSLLMGRRNSE